VRLCRYIFPYDWDFNKSFAFGAMLAGKADGNWSMTRTRFTSLFFSFF